MKENKHFKNCMDFILHIAIVIVASTIFSKVIVFDGIDSNISFLTWVIIVATFKLDSE